MRAWLYGEQGVFLPPPFQKGRQGGPLLSKVCEVSVCGMWSGQSGRRGHMLGQEVATSKHMAGTGCFCGVQGGPLNSSWLTFLRTGPHSE